MFVKIKEKKMGRSWPFFGARGYGAMLENGIPPMKVSEMTKLDIEEVQSLEQAKTSKR